MIDFEQYRIFTVVSNEKNITKAAEILHISQPAVTMRIKNLEEALNCNLFFRSKSGMELTQNGQKLYDEIHEAVEKLECAENLFISRKQIIVGTRTMIFSRLFGSTISKFYNNYPDVNIIQNAILAPELIPNLQDKKIDLAIYRYMPDELNISENIKFIELGEVEDVFFVNSDYYKKLNKKFSKKEIKSQTVHVSDSTSFRYKYLLQQLSYSKKEKENIKFTRNSTMVEMLKHINEIGFISKEFIKDELNAGTYQTLDLDFSLPKVKFGIYYNKNNIFSELRSLINLIKKDFLKN